MKKLLFSFLGLVNHGFNSPFMGRLSQNISSAADNDVLQAITCSIFRAFFSSLIATRIRKVFSISKAFLLIADSCFSNFGRLGKIGDRSVS